MNPELAFHGRELQRKTASIVAAFVERVDVLFDARNAFRMRRVDLADHTATLLDEIANELVVRGEEADPTLAKDGERIRRLLAELHAQQRKRHGWDPEHLRREYAVLREEIHSALGLREPGVEECETARMIESLLDELEEIGLRQA